MMKMSSVLMDTTFTVASTTDWQLHQCSMIKVLPLFCLSSWVDWKWRTWKWRTIKIAGHEIAGQTTEK